LINELSAPLVLGFKEELFLNDVINKQMYLKKVYANALK